MTREELRDYVEFLRSEDEISYDVYSGLIDGIDTLELQPEDAISKANVFEILGNLMSIPYDFDRQITGKDVSESMDKIRALPPVTSQPKTGHWVLVSEEMPNEFADVICCTEAKEVFVATYLGKLNDGTDCFDDYDGMMWEGDIIAWMPLPEPFEPQKVRNKCHI